MKKFPDVSLLITHYNRSQSLENLLESVEKLRCVFGNVIVSDDGSNEEHMLQLQWLQKRFGFQLITTPFNQGLGNNINKGQDVVKTPYTLYIQEDFEPTSIFPSKLEESLHYLEEDKDIDIVRYYAYSKYPYLRPFKGDFSTMYMNPWGMNYRKIYCYSDHPHLRRSSFFDKFNKYKEGISGDKTEYKMCLSFLHNKGVGIFYNNYKSLFIQKNSLTEPSTMSRESWRNSNNLFVRLARNFYRQIKYNYHISITPLLRIK